MTSPDKILNEALGILDPVEKAITESAITPPKKLSAEEDIDNDYTYQRENFYSLVERGQDAIEGILQLSKETEHPRAYEVAGQLIKSVADTTDKLADLHKKVKDIEADNPKTQNTVTNNALFVGSTSELSKMLKDGLLNNNSSE